MRCGVTVGGLVGDGGIGGENKTACQRSYQRKRTSSRPITEVKCVRAWIVLGWVTAWEDQVMLASRFLLDGGGWGCFWGDGR